MKKFIYIFVVLLLTSFLAAKIPRVFVSVKPKDIKPGDVVEIVIGAEAKKGSKFKLPKIDDIGGFKVLSKKGLVSYRFIEKDNKKIALVKRAISYKIKPTKSFDISSYKIVVNGKDITTVPFKVNLVEPKKTENKSLNKSSNSEINKSKKVKSNTPKVKDSINKVDDTPISNDFIFKMSSNKKDLVVGESFIVKVELIEPINVSSQDLQYFPPKFEGFKFQPIGDGKIEENTNSVIRTIEYLVTPIKSGKLTISPARAKVGIQLAPQGQSPFGFFGAEVEWKKLLTNSLTLNVAKIPKDVDLVGKFKLETITDSTKAKANKPFKYLLKITGLGDLDDYEAPKIDINNITVFDDKSAEIQHIMTKGVVVTRYTKEYTFISDKDFTIPSIKIRVFNPQTKKIYTLKSREINVKIKKLNSITSVLSSKNSAEKKTQKREVKFNETVPKKSIIKESSIDNKEFKKAEDLLFDKNYYKRKYNSGYPLSAIFGALLLGIILGAGAVILLPGLLRVRRKGTLKNRYYNSYEEALNILYPHTTKSKSIEDMVTKLYEVTNGNRDVKIDDYVLNKMIKKVKDS